MNTSEELSRLLAIIESLRGENGCPWDKKQTTDSLRTYLIEEAHELHDALDSRNTEHIKEELGDMFFILAFLAHLFKEKNTFTLAGAIKSINDKMVRRHPHVFDSTVDLTEEEQRQSWLSIKENEKKAVQNSQQTVFSSIPKSLPALRRAQRVSEKAAYNNLPGSETEQSVSSLKAALQDLLRKIPTTSTDPDISPSEAGNILYLIADLCRRHRINPEEALSRHIATKIDRFLEVD
jgi:MazG family protein